MEWLACQLVPSSPRPWRHGGRRSNQCQPVSRDARRSTNNKQPRLHCSPPPTICHRCWSIVLSGQRPPTARRTGRGSRLSQNPNLERNRDHDQTNLSRLWLDRLANRRHGIRPASVQPLWLALPHRSERQGSRLAAHRNGRHSEAPPPPDPPLSQGSPTRKIRRRCQREPPEN